MDAICRLRNRTGIHADVVAVGLLGNIVWRNSHFPEPFDSNDLISYVFASYTVGSVLVLIPILIGGVLGAAISYAIRRGRKETKRAWVVFMEISNNTKNAVP